MVVIDNFIKDNNLLNEINSSTDFFGPNGDFRWYDGWWNEEKNTLKHRLLHYIWRDNPVVGPFVIEGFEFWTNAYGADSKSNQNELPPHFDKDEAHWLKTNEVVSPIVGTVFYPMNNWDEVEGGHLEIFQRGENYPPEVIYPKYNRLVVFGAGQDLHRITPVTKGTRYSVAINLWDKIPSGVTNNTLKPL